MTFLFASGIKVSEQEKPGLIAEPSGNPQRPLDKPEDAFTIPSEDSRQPYSRLFSTRGIVTYITNVIIIFI